MPLPKVIPGASVLITGSRVVAGTDEKKTRHQRDLMNARDVRKFILPVKKVSLEATLFFFLIFLAGENE